LGGKVSDPNHLQGSQSDTRSNLGRSHKGVQTYTLTWDLARQGSSQWGPQILHGIARHGDRVSEVAFVETAHLIDPVIAQRVGRPDRSDLQGLDRRHAPLDVIRESPLRFPCSSFNGKVNAPI
jgi:hypothetical protein